MADIAPIAQLGAAVLRLQATAVDDVHSPDIKALIDTLHATLASSQGVGLAAPQISVSKRIIIVASRPTARYPLAPLMSPTVMINPSFQPLSDEQDSDWEGCLSIPSIRALVPRYRDIMIHYTNEQGVAVDATLSGFVARIFQHEIDHLDGKVYLDSVVDNRDIIAESEFFQRLNH